MRTHNWKLLLAGSLVIEPRLALASDGEAIAVGLGIVVDVVVVFLLLREVVCWYYKVNQRVQLLTEIRNELRQARAVRGRAAGASSATEEAGISRRDPRRKPDVWGDGHERSRE